MRGLAACDLVGWATGHQAAAASAALGPQVDHPVGLAHDVEIVLDGYDGVAEIDEAVQHRGQALGVGEVQAGGGLVEDGACAGDSLASSYPSRALRLAARRRVAGLPEREIAEPMPSRTRSARDTAGWGRSGDRFSTVIASTCAMLCPA